MKKDRALKINLDKKFKYRDELKKHKKLKKKRREEHEIRNNNWKHYLWETN